MNVGGKKVAVSIRLNTMNILCTVQMTMYTFITQSVFLVMSQQVRPLTDFIFAMLLINMTTANYCFPFMHTS